MSDAQQAETPLSQKARDLDRKISSQVEGLVKGLQSQIGDRIRAATDDVVSWIEENGPEFPHFLPDSDLDDIWASLSGSKPEPSDGAATDYGTLLAAVARLDAEQGQAEILTALLEESLRFSSRSAFFLIRDGRARGWSGKGFGNADSQIGAIEEGVEEDPWKRLLAEGSSCVCSDEELAGMAIRIDTSPADKALLVPFAIRGQVAGALYADQTADGTKLSASALQLLVHSATMALETAQVSPGLSPCLRIDQELPVDVDDDVADDEDGDGDGDRNQEVASETRVPEIEATEAIRPEAEEAPPANLVPTVEAGVPMAEPAPPEPPPAIDLPPSAEGLSKEDLETTVVPAAPESPEAEPDEELEAAEPTVEFDAPALSLGSSAQTPEVSTPEVSTPGTYTSTEYSPSEYRSEPAADTGPETEVVAPEPTEAITPEPDENFDRVAVPSDEEIALEARAEPALEDDTSGWSSTQEEEEEDDEPTQVGMAVQLDGPSDAPSLEIAADPETPVAPPAPPAPVVPEAPSAPASFPGPEMPVGQETIRLPVVSPPPSDPGDETSPSMHLPIADPAPASFTDPVPAAPTSFADPVPPAAPAAPSSFADPVPPVVPAAPSSFADPVPAAPSSFAEPSPPSFADPNPPSFAPPAAPEPEPAPKPATESPKTGGGSQVVPPADLDGPGLAFARPDETVEKPDAAGEALHEEARRLARLLVSEIKLYNEEIIEEGRRAGNIYERLKDDIDRSRQMYEERIDPRLADQEDYFYQELVQRLAGGDTGLLGL